MTKAIAQAATILWSNWQDSTHIDELPLECRPRTRSGGYAIQADVARLSGADVVGWKIAATSAAGQRHINVDGPLAGRLLSSRQLPDGATVPLRNQVMSVAEAEFAFRMGADLPARSHPYAVNEVIDAVESLHPSIEVPDSRFHDPTIVGAPQLIADMACACWFLVGEAAPPAWRGRDLVEHRVVASRNGAHAAEGGGMNVLGDPRVALTWLANELGTFADGLRVGDVVMTGTCLPPVEIGPGDRIRMDFGAFGAIAASFS